MRRDIEAAVGGGGEALIAFIVGIPLAIAVIGGLVREMNSESDTTRANQAVVDAVVTKAIDGNAPEGTEFPVTLNCNSPPYKTNFMLHIDKRTSHTDRDEISNSQINIVTENFRLFDVGHDRYGMRYVDRDTTGWNEVFHLYTTVTRPVPQATKTPATNPSLGG